MHECIRWDKAIKEADEEESQGKNQETGKNKQTSKQNRISDKS